MKYLDEYRDAELLQQLISKLGAVAKHPWTIMEICGGQTHSILRYGLDEVLPPQLSLIHGPGCPVCVTPVGLINQAIVLAMLPQMTLCTFGDMLRVPGTNQDLQLAKAQGGNVRIVYSPLDTVELATRDPTREFVFFAVGFETTVPATALAILRAKQRGLSNFTVLSAHVRVPPAVHAILNSPECRVQGLLAAGHVCAVMGCEEYEPLARGFHLPIVVTGFEPVDILYGLLECVEQLERGAAEVVNRYVRSVRQTGNTAAQKIVHDVFEPVDRAWRGLASIPESGWAIRPIFASYDAAVRFGLASDVPERESDCIAGEVLQGHKKPIDCPAFGVRCTPLQPMGAPMVSSEGACAAYYRYRLNEIKPVRAELVHE